MSKLKNITLGCDPEVFLKDESGFYIPSIGRFGGTKEEPLPISKDGHCIQEDNVALEFNIPPSADAATFKRHINFVLENINARAKEQGLMLAVESSAEFDPVDLDSEAAKTFGCEPDFCAWTEAPNIPPSPEGNLRTCGGHIHIGYDDPDYETNLELIKVMDLFLGIPSLFIDQDTQRRTMYGKAGCFRPKDFGVEYRVLSNFWLKSDELIEWAFNATIQAIEFVNNGGTLSTEHEELLQKAIDSSDLEIANTLVEEYSLIVPKVEENAEVIQ